MAKQAKKVVKKTAKKTTKKVVKKTAPKKANKKAAPKKSAKKTSAKKVAPKKVATKKTAVKKSAPKKGKKAAKKAQTRAKKTKKVTVQVAAQTKATPKETHYLLVLDESTSMGSVREETRKGLNEQIKTIKDLQKQYPDQDYFVTIVKFSTEVGTLISDVSAGNVKEFTEADYTPNGWTALYDAIGIGVTNLKARIQSRLDSGEACALVVILTDGEENQSKQFNSNQIKELITGLEGTGLWTFTFIGANQDSVLAARSMGINVNNTVNYTASGVGTQLAFASVNAALKKRAVYTKAGVYAATTDNFLSEVTRGVADLGENADALDLSGNVSDEELEKMKAIAEQKSKSSNS